jgi:hypothetical protein
MEVYKALNSRKVYLVFNRSEHTLIRESTKYFKVSKKDLLLREAYLYNDELYFENPHKKGTKKCITVESVRRRS